MVVVLFKGYQWRKMLTQGQGRCGFPSTSDFQLFESADVEVTDVEGQLYCLIWNELLRMEKA